MPTPAQALSFEKLTTLTDSMLVVERFADELFLSATALEMHCFF